MGSARLAAATVSIARRSSISCSRSRSRAARYSADSPGNLVPIMPPLAASDIRRDSVRLPVIDRLRHCDSSPPGNYGRAQSCALPLVQFGRTSAGANLVPSQGTATRVHPEYSNSWRTFEAGSEWNPLCAREFNIPLNCARALCYLPRNERRCPLTLSLRLVPASSRTSPSLDLSTLGDELLRFRLGQIEFHPISAAVRKRKGHSDCLILRDHLTRQIRFDHGRHFTCHDSPSASCLDPPSFQRCCLVLGYMSRFERRPGVELSFRATFGPNASPQIRGHERAAE